MMQDTNKYFKYTFYVCSQFTKNLVSKVENIVHDNDIKD